MSEWLVTGAVGFLGSHVVKALAQRGQQVRGLIQSKNEAGGWTTSGVDPFVGDLLDKPSMQRAVSGVKRVIHCAAKTPGKADADLTWRTNVEGTKILLEASAKEGVERFVFVSTDSVYGDGHCEGSSESDPTSPTYYNEGNYPESKLNAENQVRAFGTNRALAWTIVRTCLMYGPGTCPGNEVIKRWASSTTHFLVGGGTARLSLAFVTDVAELLIAVAGNAVAKSQCYNVCDGNPHSRREMLVTLADITQRPKRLISLPAWFCRALATCFRPYTCWTKGGATSRFHPDAIDFQLSDHVINIDKARRELGFTPNVGLREGLATTLQWMADPVSIL